MSADDFWHNSDYKLFWAYREKHLILMEMNITQQRDLANFNAWLNGVYIGNAVSDLFSNEKSFPNAPIDFNELEKEAKRKANMSKEEIIAEEVAKIELESRLEKERLIAILKRKNKKKGE